MEKLAASVSEHSGYPLIYIIDELDRCRPTFAIALLERIKHFLDVPDIVFILALNRKQLEEAVKCVYGREIDAPGYLAKFVHIWCGLPKENPTHHITYTDALYRAFDPIWTNNDDHLPELMPHLAALFSLTLREMERLYTGIAVISTLSDKPREFHLMSMAGLLCIIRMRDLDVFLALKNGHIRYGELAQRIPELNPSAQQDLMVSQLLTSLKFHLMNDLEYQSTTHPEGGVIELVDVATMNKIGRGRVIPHICDLLDTFDQG